MSPGWSFGMGAFKTGSSTQASARVLVYIIVFEQIQLGLSQSSLTWHLLMLSLSLNNINNACLRPETVGNSNTDGKNTHGDANIHFSFTIQCSGDSVPGWGLSFFHCKTVMLFYSLTFGGNLTTRLRSYTTLRNDSEWNTHDLPTKKLVFTWQWVKTDVLDVTWKTMFVSSLEPNKGKPWKRSKTGVQTKTKRCSMKSCHLNGVY